MPSFQTLNPAQRDALPAELHQRYENFQSRGLALDMTRGKPAPEQLDLAQEMLDLPGRNDYRDDNGADCRNYGGLDGLPQMKQLFAEILEVAPQQVIVGGNASLNMMYDTLARACLFGVPGGSAPWASDPQRKFLCPSPGYDRHFTVTEELGFELITVEMNDNGPDMEQVEQLAAADAGIKGIWCVPKYSNPTGVTYSDETVRRLAAMHAAAPDFRILWDNAYAEHHLGTEHDPLANISQACEAAGNPDRVVQFASTSKVSFAGSGVAALASSGANIADAKRHLAAQTIGPDKLNQLRHLQYFKNLDGLREHMAKHAALLKPKFDLVLELLGKELKGKDIAEWTSPNGGYFISLDVIDGTANRVVQLAGEAGVKLTSAGATYPYGKDPRDRNIRIAPSFPSLGDIRQAMEVLAICVQLAALEKLKQG
ncbi:MAG: aminotransferase class I/II-fold pyridoxal phosphate-dependent enzyme [Pseudomonadota bacterium]|nr:aminotransferase class I/II-fold pyridoxal phosphate-dependent enzyme [Pseudomonadota bacterium]